MVNSLISLKPDFRGLEDLRGVEGGGGLESLPLEGAVDFGDGDEPEVGANFEAQFFAMAPVNPSTAFSNEKGSEGSSLRGVDSFAESAKRWASAVKSDSD